MTYLFDSVEQIDSLSDCDSRFGFSVLRRCIPPGTCHCGTGARVMDVSRSQPVRVLRLGVVVVPLSASRDVRVGAINLEFSVYQDHLILLHPFGSGIINL